MNLDSMEFICANSLDFFDIAWNLLERIANFLRVFAEVISANLIQIRTN